MLSENRKGFTLIELAVVLVIIGLVAGGVLAGRSLIEGAQLRDQLRQMEELESQINSFRGKYGCLPGDCSNAASLLGGSYGGDTIINGDDNGDVNSSVGSGAPYAKGECLLGSAGGEPSQLFLQLNAAGLGRYSADGASYIMNRGFPEAALGNGMIVTCIKTSNAHSLDNTALRPTNIIALGVSPSNAPGINSFRLIYSLGMSAWRTSPYSANIGIMAPQARAIDQKIDDGVYNTGIFGGLSGDGGRVYNATTLPTARSQLTVGKSLGSGG